MAECKDAMVAMLGRCVPIKKYKSLSCGWNPVQVYYTKFKYRYLGSEVGIAWNASSCFPQFEIITMQVRFLFEISILIKSGEAKKEGFFDKYYYGD